MLLFVVRFCLLVPCSQVFLKADMKKSIDVTQKGSRQVYANIAHETLQILAAEEKRFSAEAEKSILFTENDLADPLLDAALVHATAIEVTAETTLAALYRLAGAADAVGLLNFASAKNIGGGFKKGSNAQEESLARSSSLFVHLSRFSKPFYMYNKSHPGVYSHRIIFSPSVSFFKDDRGSLVKSVSCAVVTSPAVNAGVAKCSADEVEQTMRERMARILRAFQLNKVSCIILGAFGCGVFKNDPVLVASIWSDLLFGEFKNVFQKVVFACYGPEENLSAFKKKFK